jgi:hypothetical protein
MSRIEEIDQYIFLVCPGQEYSFVSIMHTPCKEIWHKEKYELDVPLICSCDVRMPPETKKFIKDIFILTVIKDLNIHI